MKHALAVAVKTKASSLTVWRPAAFGDFQEKNREKHVALCKNFSGPLNATDPVKGSKNVASLLACIRKKLFFLGVRIFCE